MTQTIFILLINNRQPHICSFTFLITKNAHFTLRTR